MQVRNPQGCNDCYALWGPHCDCNEPVSIPGPRLRQGFFNSIRTWWTSWTPIMRTLLALALGLTISVFSQ